MNKQSMRTATGWDSVEGSDEITFKVMLDTEVFGLGTGRFDGGPFKVTKRKGDIMNGKVTSTAGEITFAIEDRLYYLPSKVLPNLRIIQRNPLNSAKNAEDESVAQAEDAASDAPNTKCPPSPGSAPRITPNMLCSWYRKTTMSAEGCL